MNAISCVNLTACSLEERDRVTYSPLCTRL